MYKLWMEWDFGQDSLVFSSENAALEWVSGLELDYTLEELIEQGLISLEKIEYV